jgi:hypothetical protein
MCVRPAVYAIEVFALQDTITGELLQGSLEPQNVIHEVG